MNSEITSVDPKKQSVQLKGNDESAVFKRSLIRKISIMPGFHQIDMMGVVHNGEFIRWFEEGRLRILLEVIPLECAQQRGIALPVIENRCKYHTFCRYGDRLVLTTSHRISSEYRGKLRFMHSLVNERTKVEVASGETVVTLVEFPSGNLIKQWPSDLWERYLCLK